MRRTYPRGLLLAVEVGTTALIIGVIWLLTANSHNPFIPSLGKILSTFRSVWLFQRFSSDVLPSVERLAIGFSVAVAVGIPLGLLIGMSKWVRMLTRPVTTFM
ncbi:MAG: ABC transporter permease, partial [Solirubrobacteraceae bacterium]